jgi:hypothetical protein
MIELLRAVDTFSIWLFNSINDIEVRHEIIESTKGRLRLWLYDSFIGVCAREFVDGFHGIPKREYDEFNPSVERAAQQVSALIALDLSQFWENGSRRMSNVFACSFDGGLSLPHAQNHDVFSGLIGVAACLSATLLHSRTIEIIDGGVRTRTGDLGVMNPAPDPRIDWHLRPKTNITNNLQPPRERIYYHHLRSSVICFGQDLGKSL